MAHLPYVVSRSPAPPANFAGVLEESERALEALIRAKPRLELFDIVERTDDIAAAKGVAVKLLENTSSILVLGIGGSSLGGQALKDLAPSAGAQLVQFFDNPDPVTYECALQSSDLTTTRFIAISKSGGTPETLAQTLIAADALKRAGEEKYLSRHSS
jgi:glucose-6-phosphate isomerase